MDLTKHTITPSRGCEALPSRVGGVVRRCRSGVFSLLAAAGVAVALAAPATALDLPLLGKPERGGNRQQPGSGFVPPGRQAAEESDSRQAREAAREAQAINGGGRVLSVDEANGGWRVKLLKDGNVRFVFVPN